MGAVADTGTRTELIASRARIMAAADEARRQLERNLRDGIQQRLISMGYALRQVEASLPRELDSAREQLRDVSSQLAATCEELRDISRGLHPPILSVGGLHAALTSLARQSAVPVKLDLTIDRRSGDCVELAAYYVVAEALTNAAKHAQASELNVSARAKDHTLYVSIKDNGVGGADPRKGTGLIGLKDRVEALSGHIDIVSNSGVGTALHMAIPFPDR
jgi:signal transduction histidine kinase